MRPRNVRDRGGCRLDKEPPQDAARQLHLWDAPVRPGSPPPPASPDSAGAATPPVTVRPKPSGDSPPASPELESIFARVFRRLRVRGEAPVFHASFQAFAGLRSTIRVKRRNVIEARLSDLLAGARPLVIEALAEILLTRLYRVRTSHEARECYQAWAQSPEVIRRIEEVRRQRGRKVLRPPRGFHFDLRAIFDDLNCRFFSGEIQGVRIGWSPIRSRTLLGHYDSSHRTITVTRWLDGPRVPRYVVEYLVFHEMLHERIPVEHRNHRRVVHPPAFVAAERAFPDYARAARWLRTGRGRSGATPWEEAPSS